MLRSTWDSAAKWTTASQPAMARFGGSCIADITFYKFVIGITGYDVEICEVSGVGQFVVS